MGNFKTVHLVFLPADQTVAGIQLGNSRKSVPPGPCDGSGREVGMFGFKLGVLFMVTLPLSVVVICGLGDCSRQEIDLLNQIRSRFTFDATKRLHWINLGKTFVLYPAAAQAFLVMHDTQRG